MALKLSPDDFKPGSRIRLQLEAAAAEEQAVLARRQERIDASVAGRPVPGRKSSRPAAAVPKEHDEQVELVQMLERWLPEMYLVMTAVPHGGGRSPGEAGRLVAEGVRAGYPDLLFDEPRGPFHGLRIEMKRQKSPKSRTSSEQAEWAARLNARGYLCVIAYGGSSAFEQAVAYWHLGPFRSRAGADLDAFVFIDGCRPVLPVNQTGEVHG